MKRTIKTLLALTLGLATIAAWAERPSRDDGDERPGHHRDGRDPKKHFERMVKELNLTKDQQDKAKVIHEKRQSASKTQEEKIRPLHEELGKLLEADKVDLTVVRQKLETIGRAKVDMRMADIQCQLEFEALLTPEQKTKLRAMHKKAMEKHHDRDKRNDKKDNK